MSTITQRITPFLWFDGQAEQAANFYTSVFKNSKIVGVSRYDENTAQAAGRPAGSAMTVAFQLDGQDFVALNGGPEFKFTEAVSFVVNCQNQQEIDYYWEKLTAGGGSEVACGWLRDKYGLSWQVVPVDLWTWLKDAAASQRVMQEVLQMKKLDLATMKRAYEGKTTETTV